jgi:hypothetical protein
VKPKYTVVKANGEWNVIDRVDGSFVASFSTKWEAEDFASQMNEHEERITPSARPSGLALCRGRDLRGGQWRKIARSRRPRR